MKKFIIILFLILCPLCASAATVDLIHSLEAASAGDEVSGSFVELFSSASPSVLNITIPETTWGDLLNPTAVILLNITIPTTTLTRKVDLTQSIISAPAGDELGGSFVELFSASTIVLNITIPTTEILSYTLESSEAVLNISIPTLGTRPKWDQNIEWSQGIEWAGKAGLKWTGNRRTILLIP